MLYKINQQTLVASQFYQFIQPQLYHIYRSIFIYYYQQNKMNEQLKSPLRRQKKIYDDPSNFKYKFIPEGITSKDTLNQIMILFKMLGSYTDSLEEKVDLLLRKQQNQFFKCYKSHLNNINGIVQDLKQKIQGYEKKINAYENEGTLAQLIKKNNSLDRQVLQMYRRLQQKDKLIEQYKIKLSICKKQQIRLNQKLKNQMRKKQKLKQINSLFTTQVTQTRMYTKEKCNKTTIETLPQQSIQPTKKQQLVLDYTYEIRHRLQTQLQKVKKKNTQLISRNVKITSLHNQLQQFFFDCVTKVKKDICSRNKMNYCTFQQFKKQDRLNVLILLLENQDILKAIYNNIFNAKNTQNNQGFTRRQKSQNLKFQNIDTQRKNLQTQKQTKLPQLKIRSNSKSMKPRSTLKQIKFIFSGV